MTQLEELISDGWDKILNWGTSSELYGKGQERVMYDCDTGKIWYSYSLGGEGHEVLQKYTMQGTETGQVPPITERLPRL